MTIDIITVGIKPLEPLMFRGSGELDPSSRGVYSHALSLIIPRPSTITGALITYLLTQRPQLAKYCTSISSFTDLLECYRRVLEEFGIYAVRGPYFYSSRKDVIYIPIILGDETLLVEYDQLRYYFLQEHGDILRFFFEKNANEEFLLKFKHIEKELKANKLSLLQDKLFRTGIMLSDRTEYASKTTVEGCIYTVRYITYPFDIELRFKLIISNSSPLLDKELCTALKLGGDHRVAKFSLDCKCKDKVDGLLKLSSASTKYYLLLSPLPIKEYIDVKYIGILDVIGLGFSIAKSRRKPLYPALLEGSIVKISTDKYCLEDLLKRGLYGLLGVKDEEFEALARIGYASFIPL